MKIFDTKIKEKFKRQKESVKFKLRDIELLFDSLSKKQDNLLNLTKRNSTNNLSALNQSNDGFGGKQEKSLDVTNFMDKTSRTLLNYDEEIKNLKKKISANKALNNSKKSDQLELKMELKYDILFKEIRDKIKIITDIAASKSTREDLADSHKTLLIEIDKLVYPN